MRLPGTVDVESEPWCALRELAEHRVGWHRIVDGVIISDLGSFEEPSFDAFETTLLSGLQTLVSQGATQLVVDVVSAS